MWPLGSQGPRIAREPLLDRPASKIPKTALSPCIAPARAIEPFTGSQVGRAALISDSAPNDHCKLLQTLAKRASELQRLIQWRRQRIVAAVGAAYLILASRLDTPTASFSLARD
jgi:hypothetical protein